MESKDKKLLLALTFFILAVTVYLVVTTLNTTSQGTVIFITGEENSTLISAGDSAAQFPVDINKVTKEQLMEIDGIGEKTAAAMIEYRIKNSGFKNMNELLNIDGIGEKTLDKLIKYLYINDEDTETSTKSVAVIPENTQPNTNQETTFPTTTTTVKTTSLVVFPLDINFAEFDELIQLKGIGEAKANSIIEYRNTIGFFYKTADIMLVDGIGESTFDNIKGFIKVDLSRLPKQSETVGEVTTPQTTTTTSQTTTITTTTFVTTTTELGGQLVNINTATYDEFMQLPGMTDEIVNKILNHRDLNNCIFTEKTEILMFISIDKYNQIKEYLTV